MVLNAENIQCNVTPVNIRQLVNILPLFALYLNNYTQHNTTQFTHVTFNNHSKIFQGQSYSIKRFYNAKINALGSG